MLFQAVKDAEESTAQQRKNPPVGSGDAIFTPFAADLSPPWSILAMTDGVWKYAGWGQGFRQSSASQDGQEICDKLRDAAKLLRTGSLQDDFTLAVLRSN